MRPGLLAIVPVSVWAGKASFNEAQAMRPGILP